MVNQESAPGTPGTRAAPAALSTDARIDARTRRGRLTMLFLLLVCASPVIASYLAYYVFTPAGGKAAYGALVEPQRPIPTGLMVQDEHGAEVPLASLKGKWLMVSVDNSACDDNCARKLFTMRQLRIGQGPDRDRIVPVWLVTDRGAIDPRLMKAYNDDYAAARFLRAPELPKDWLTDGKTPATDHIFLVDPQGNLMMQFPKDPDPKKVRGDLTRLLKYSRIG
ncbi:cytochrome C oxidase subunit I [Ralstonia insidiosa]|jgi:cytochrome oxidase Cu insertion factor (SCO1/SenC/PrrC family)|uniref:SCO family protein n=2 Tax=Pseudomonadota TaxID=1224 RepID=UPI000664A0E0|nr:cytochrome c oxidase subunit I [Ralstonia insidiosa]KMW46344.1 cytochrome C oxidase subunit I [Ralstonia sp. MD27]MBX3771963.1 cytochrome C oxidase subunit I [Ralstonia pickettii]NOZ18471.1 cytochrome C oxidase subunit I [Betaproteobacteria bacterium]MBA9856060.1 cytochrome C oxidase subunit I [Ralstonia insidiosa]MBA9873631.1 cytochrome C oxidase subunit I [Ralstonia insidiosa]